MHIRENNFKILRYRLKLNFSHKNWTPSNVEKITKTKAQICNQTLRAQKGNFIKHKQKREGATCNLREIITLRINRVRCSLLGNAREIEHEIYQFWHESKKLADFEKSSPPSRCQATEAITSCLGCPKRWEAWRGGSFARTAAAFQTRACASRAREVEKRESWAILGSLVFCLLTVRRPYVCKKNLEFLTPCLPWVAEFLKVFCLLLLNYTKSKLLLKVFKVSKKYVAVLNTVTIQILSLRVSIFTK